MGVYIHRERKTEIQVDAGRERKTERERDKNASRSSCRSTKFIKPRSEKTVEWLGVKKSS